MEELLNAMKDDTDGKIYDEAQGGSRGSGGWRAINIEVVRKLDEAFGTQLTDEIVRHVMWNISSNPEIKKRVAERDAKWEKAHPGRIEAMKRVGERIKKNVGLVIEKDSDIDTDLALAVSSRHFSLIDLWNRVKAESAKTREKIRLVVFDDIDSFRVNLQNQVGSNKWDDKILQEPNPGDRMGGTIGHSFYYAYKPHELWNKEEIWHNAKREDQWRLRDEKFGIRW